MFDIAWCDKYGPSLSCLLFFINSLISREIFGAFYITIMFLCLLYNHCVLKSISESAIKVMKIITVEYLRKCSSYLYEPVARVKQRCQHKKLKCNLPSTSHFSTSVLNFLNQQRQNQISYTKLSFLKINIEAILETYTWIICHRTTVINNTEHLKDRKRKEIRLKTSSVHLTRTVLKYLGLDLGLIKMKSIPS